MKNDVVCEGEDRTFEVSVYTDQWTPEDSNFWTLEQQNGRFWDVVASQNLTEGYMWYNDTLCLPKDENFRWTISDTFGDGLCECTYYANPDECTDEDYWYCGSYALYLDDELLTEDIYGAFDYGVTISFSTVYCFNEDDSADFIFDGLSYEDRTCGSLEYNADSIGEDVCRMKLDGTRIYDICKRTCGNLGIGPCRFLADL